jgi:hypothetical protein
MISVRKYINIQILLRGEVVSYLPRVNDDKKREICHRLMVACRKDNILTREVESVQFEEVETGCIVSFEI